MSRASRQPRLNRQVVVIGAGVGGLSAAIHARLAGNDVLVLEQNSAPGGKAAGREFGGYRIDPGPSIIILKGLYEDLFCRAGRSMGDYLEFERLDFLTRVNFEWSAPLELPGDGELCLKELVDRFPNDADQIRMLMKRGERLMADIQRTVFARPFDHPWQVLNLGMMRISKALGGQRSYRKVVDGWFSSPELRAFFYGFPSYGGQTYDSIAPGAFLIPYFMISEGVFYPKGGVAAIPKALYRLAVELGVEFRFDLKVHGLRRTSKRIVAVETSEESIPCDAVISNVDRHTTGKWLGRATNLEPSFSYFTIHWGVHIELKSLHCHNLFVPRDFEFGFEQLYRQREFPDSPIVYVNAPSAVDPTTAPAGCSNVFMVATSPAMTDSIEWESAAPRAKDAILRTLERCGLDISAEAADFELVQTPVTFAERHGNYRGSLYGADEKHRLFGMFPPRNYDEEYGNLFYCGGSVQPGAGLPMVILSGKFAAERVSKA